MQIKHRSMGVKMLLLCGLAILMLIPAALIDSMIGDRAERATEVTNQISAESGGPQTILGPTLVIPWIIHPATRLTNGQLDAWIVSPVNAVANLKTSTEERQRSLFRVPVFHSDVQFEADFDLTNVAASIPAGCELDWSHAEMLIGISDAHGMLADSTLAIAGTTQTFYPATIATDVRLGRPDDASSKLTLFGASATGIATPQSKFHITSSLKFSGAKSLSVLAWGKTTHVAMTGDWKHPGFGGNFLPAHRTTGDSGFSVDWSIPFAARGVRSEGLDRVLSGLESTAMETSFVEVADAYQSVTRSVKYALLVIGLVFLSYFAFEITTGKRVHPAQYLMVGIAQLVFYLLLLSLAERTGFDAGYAIAGTATVILLAVNAGWVFERKLQAIRAAVCFSLLYSLIYLLLRMEDNALLVGSIGSFAAVAALMYLTRSIDWYGSPNGVDVA